MPAVLSYFEEYFTPEADAPLSGHSTGQIAGHLFSLLERRMGCRYVPQQPQSGLRADLFVGHFWSFLDYCRLNEFRHRIAMYPVANPVWTTELLLDLAGRFDVPMPWWDLPPRSFDHRATMDAADAVLVVGNRFTLETFSPDDRRKVRLLNYAPDDRQRPVGPAPPPLVRSRAGVAGPETTQPCPNSVCYVATHCDLRKGFMDVLETWSGLGCGEATLHVLGAIRQPWDRLLADHRPANIHYHGFVNSKEPAYAEVMRTCRFAYLPTYSEGQVGTLLEAIQQGCVPITTRASGLDEAVLEHCVLVEARDVEGQRQAIREAVSWSDDRFRATSARLRELLAERHTWSRFETSVAAVIDEVMGRPSRRERGGSGAVTS
jgi:glycosyltransferase involved in cell wall biosynthesis